MVKADDATADASSARVIVGGDQRTHSGVGPEDSRVRKARGKFGSLRQKQVHLVRRDAEMVAFLVRNFRGSGTDDTDRVSRDENVGVGRLTATIDDNIVDPVGKNKQCSLSRKHADVRSGHLRDVMSPDSSGVDSHGSVVVRHDPGVMVKNLDPFDSVLLLDDLDHF